MNQVFPGHRQMKTKQLTLIAGALMLFNSTGWTADDDGEATIRLMGAAEAELPEAVTKQITIPTHLMKASTDQQRAVEKAEKGLDKAEERHERREEKGLQQADEARDRGVEMSENARENRDNRGRSEDRPEKPEGPPDPI